MCSHATRGRPALAKHLLSRDIRCAGGASGTPGCNVRSWTSGAPTISSYQAAGRSY